MAYPSNHDPDGSDGVAQAQLRAFVERILRMKEEARAINEDVREIYAEAKANGYDKTVLGQLVSYVEKREKDPAAHAERSAIFDLYLEAFDGTGTKNAIAHTHEERALGGLAGFVPFHPKPGAITEPATPAKPLAADVADAPGGDPHTTPPGATESRTDVANAVRPVGVNTSLAGAEGDEDRQPIPLAADAPPAAQTVPDPGLTLAAEIEAVEISAPIPKRNPFRPHCQKPDACGSSNPRGHCFTCQQALADAEGFAP